MTSPPHSAPEGPPPWFISCVAPNSAHPSGRLAQAYERAGCRVVVSLRNARSPTALLGDGIALWRMLRQARAQGQVPRAALVNVNGSLAQLIALTLLRAQGCRTGLWIMDSYPGCLRYVTRLWPLFWLPFFMASLIAETCAHAIFVIDEDFTSHAPRRLLRSAKIHVVPLPIWLPAQQKTRADPGKPAVIGILGNIEQSWLDRDFLPFAQQARAAGHALLIATSRPVVLPPGVETLAECRIPWEKADTETVFAACDLLLVPLSPARLRYSAPSKIVEGLARGLQPVILCPRDTWAREKHRKIYRNCLHAEAVLQPSTRARTPKTLQVSAEPWTLEPDARVESTLAMTRGDAPNPKPTPATTKDPRL